MLSSESPIFDLYSKDIPIDPNGKVLPWLWVVLLPFIDENRITSAVKLCENEMTEEEKRRNSFGFPLIFFDKDHPLGIYQQQQLQQQQPEQPQQEQPQSEQEKQLESNDDNNNTNNNKKPLIYFHSDVGNGICGCLKMNNNLLVEYGINQLIKAPDRPVRAFQSISNNRLNFH